MVSVIPWKKELIPRFTEESILKFGTEWNLNTQKTLFLRKSQHNSTKRFEFPRAGFYFFYTEHFSLPRNGSEPNSTICFYFCSTVQIPSIILFQGMVRNGISRVFCSAEQPEFRRNKPVVPSIPSFAE
jgi:hypothetical protein